MFANLLTHLLIIPRRGANSTCIGIHCIAPKWKKNDERETLSVLRFKVLGKGLLVNWFY